MAPTTLRALAIAALGLLALGCDANPDGPRVPPRLEAEDPGTPAQPLPPKGPRNPRGLQEVKPD